MSECRLCHGTKHVLDRKTMRWVSCRCLSDVRGVERYRRAGIPLDYDSETWPAFVKKHRVSDKRKLLVTARDLKAGGNPGWLLLHGLPHRSRDLAWALVAKSACDSGREVRTVDLKELIEAEFSDEDRGRAYYVSEILIVRVGGEPANKWNRHVLQKLLRVRSEKRLWTLVVAEADPSRLGALYKSPSISESLTTLFSWVKIERKS